MNRLSDLVAAINQRIASTPEFQATLTTKAVPVISEDAHDLETKIQETIEGLGLLVLVGMPSIKNLEPDKKPMNALIQIEVGIGELVLLNRDPESTENTKIKALDAAVTAAIRLRGWEAGSAWSKLRVLEINFVPDKKKQIYRIVLEADAML